MGIPPQWKVVVKGGPNRRGWEISVVKLTNTHGQRSYGWFGDEKIMIGSSGGPCDDMVSEFVWNKLVGLAEEVSDRMNWGQQDCIPRKD
jgi:hypothetical protein